MTACPSQHAIWLAIRRGRGAYSLFGRQDDNRLVPVVTHARRYLQRVPAPKNQLKRRGFPRQVATMSA